MDDYERLHAAIEKMREHLTYGERAILREYWQQLGVDQERRWRWMRLCGWCLIWGAIGLLLGRFL